ncbi:hypothetical protein CDAR_505591 [Caerostris darwini]|uniref:Uncharacterized protein n=1 Tax=Caerostris darwini TaxID=1538125 RepID=A0AAV4PM69_9ARAC|nr:hypothetical protein CDAR_505591 [Caerostris darwini]
MWKPKGVAQEEPPPILSKNSVRTKCGCQHRISERNSDQLFQLEKQAVVSMLAVLIFLIQRSRSSTSMVTFAFKQSGCAGRSDRSHAQT